MQRRYGTHLTMRNIRRVWAAITANPRASKREIADDLDLAFSSVGGALRFLKDTGYICSPKGASRAITIVVPFYVEELK